MIMGIFGPKRLHFLCGLFNDAVSRCDYVASNDRFTNDCWIDKYVNGSDCGLM